MTDRPPITASLRGGAVACWVATYAWRLSSRRWAWALVLMPPVAVAGRELDEFPTVAEREPVVALPPGFEELPPPPDDDEGEAEGLLPPNIDPPEDVPVAAFPPDEELGGLLLLVLGLLPPNIDPPEDRLDPPEDRLDPPDGRLDPELRPFWARAEVENETRNARAIAPTSRFDTRI
ncbi:hypothetical protein [Aquisphaera insulae]|uniref:hypothetical protein n=1 Tax=Aquisphaera insulae TaxID=2712864 RepID=UPI0013EA9052|nr:hypothetical protein [Aquisphaera insulae]